MAEYRHSGHAVCDIKYHVVWITKYRYRILRGEVAERARALIRQICHAREVYNLREKPEAYFRRLMLGRGELDKLRTSRRSVELTVLVPRRASCRPHGKSLHDNAVSRR